MFLLYTMSTMGRSGMIRGEIIRVTLPDRKKPWWTARCATHDQEQTGLALRRIAQKTIDDDLHCTECARARYPALRDKEFTLSPGWSEYLGGFMTPLPVTLQGQVIDYSPIEGTDGTM